MSLSSMLGTRWKPWDASSSRARLAPAHDCLGLCQPLHLSFTTDFTSSHIHLFGLLVAQRLFSPEPLITFWFSASLPPTIRIQFHSTSTSPYVEQRTTFTIFHPPTMATPAATKRLTKEYAAITKSPPPYIIAHPSEKNILEWHYILTGPADTPYDGGQYWGTLMFPPDYPFAPPAIRMHTPSGRFQPSTRLCLSISDFHPKSFNPAWEVSTILTGLLSFMTSEEMTTGSVRASEQERKLFAQRTKWWNSTGGGSKQTSAQSSNSRGIGGIKAGDGGAKFRLEWPEVDEENLKWMNEKHIDAVTGLPRPAPSTSQSHCPPEVAGLRRRPGASATVVQDAAQIARDAGQGWLSRYKWHVVAGAIFMYILVARVLGDGAIANPA